MPVMYAEAREARNSRGPRKSVGGCHASQGDPRAELALELRILVTQHASRRERIDPHRRKAPGGRIDTWSG